MILPKERVILIAGHYGSGKTNIAVNLAVAYAVNGIKTAICDLDIVNPYYRTKDSSELLASHGVKLISSPYANSNVDLPALPQEIYALTERRDMKAIFDIGGDDRGALALGRYAPAILEENDYIMAYVVNFCRPLTRDARSALQVMREIEAAGGIRFTHLINNTNLADQTTAEMVEAGERIVRSCAERMGILSVVTAAKPEILKQITTELPCLPVRRYMAPEWMEEI